MILSRFLVAAAVASLATAAAVAQSGVGSGAGGGAGGGGMFRNADTNGDGMISRAEASAEAGKRFDALDLDKDGFLTADEMTGPGGRMLQRADADGDGKVSRAEYLAQAAIRFDRVDTNKDGMLSRDELAAWMERARGAMQGRGGRVDPADAVGRAPTTAATPSTNPGQ